MIVSEFQFNHLVDIVRTCWQTGQTDTVSVHGSHPELVVSARFQVFQHRAVFVGVLVV